VIRIRLESEAGGYHLAVQGHAGFAPKGKDVVCAGVSALVETLAIGLERIAPGGGRARVAAGSADFWLEPEADPATRAVFRTVAAGLADLAASYPRFVRFEDRTGAPAAERRTVPEP
jgi:uncharacterized protein YsxB (DUF464 family)